MALASEGLKTVSETRTDCSSAIPGSTQTSSDEVQVASISIETSHTIEEIYEAIIRIESDVRLQLPILRHLASQCNHVTELGTRYGLSTIALLAGRPETVVSWDIEPSFTQRALLLNYVKKVEGKRNPKLEGRVGNSLKISSIEPTCMLYIDTVHNFEQLRGELKRHGNQARMFIAAHDTSPEAYGYKDETEKGPGLRAALRWFQEQNFPRWQLVLDDKSGSGIIVLQRHNTPFFPFFGAEFLEGPKEALA